MSNIIKIKNSGTASATPSYLEYGELALNYNDEKIFYKNSLNEIVEFDLTGAGGGGGGVEGTVYASTLGNGVDDQFVISHNFNSRDVTVSIREANSPYGLIITQWEATTEDSITVYFESPPTLNSVRVSVYIAVAGLEVGPQGATGPEGPHGPPGNIGSAVLDDLSNVTAPSPSNGDFLKWNGTAWVNDSIDLATDTVGSYVSSLVAGTGITLTNNSGEGATPTISIGQAVATNSDVSFNSVTAGGVEVGLFSSTITTSSGNLTIAPASLTVNIGNNIVATGTISGSSVITNSIVFEGATADANETTLQVLDPTADRTISLPDATGTVSLAEIIIAQQTASYTLVLSDKDKMVEMNVSSANNLTVPPDSTANFAIGSQITILQTGTGQTTIVAGSGVTVNATPGLKLRARWSSVTLIKRAANTWVALGDLQA